MRNRVLKSNEEINITLTQVVSPKYMFVELITPGDQSQLVWSVWSTQLTCLLGC